MGDGESAEGNVWEAINFAGFYKLDNLCAIIDVNRLGQSDPAPLQHDMEAYRYCLFSLDNFLKCYWDDIFQNILCILIWSETPPLETFLLLQFIGLFYYYI